MQLAKSLTIPELPKELDEPTRKVFRKLFENLQRQHRNIRNDIVTMESANFVLAGVRWRIKIVDSNLEVQKKISGTWTTMGKWSE